MNKGFVGIIVIVITVAIIAFLFVKYIGVFVNNPGNSATSTSNGSSWSLLAPIDYARQAASSADQYSQNIQKVFDQAKKAGQAK